MPTVINVKILGDEYPIKVTSDESYLREVARFVDGKMSEIEAGLAVKSPKKVAILAALNIADEYLKQKEVYEETVRVLEEKLSDLTSALEL